INYCVRFQKETVKAFKWLDKGSSATIPAINAPVLLIECFRIQAGFAVNRSQFKSISYCGPASPDLSLKAMVHPMRSQTGRGHEICRIAGDACRILPHDRRAGAVSRSDATGHLRVLWPAG